MRAVPARPPVAILLSLSHCSYLIVAIYLALFRATLPFFESAHAAKAEQRIKDGRQHINMQHRWRRRTGAAQRQPPDQKITQHEIIEKRQPAHPTDKGPPAGDEQAFMRRLDFVDFRLHQTGLLGDARQHGFFIQPLLIGGKQCIEQIADRLNRAGHLIRGFAQERKHGHIIARAPGTGIKRQFGK